MKSRGHKITWAPFFHQGRGKVEDSITWKRFDCSIQDHLGKTYFSLKNVEAPESWSQTAVEIAASKYFRQAGVPTGKKRSGGETSIRQMVGRVVDAIVDFALERKYLRDSKQARIYGDELRALLYQQRASFNSPVWFNCGLWNSYKIKAEGLRFAWDFRHKKVVELDEVYQRPQVSACFIQGLGDDLESIFDLVKNEARIFKYGSGSGTNFSGLRSRYENLSGGGHSSGVLAFLEVFDRAAGSIKSGGITRRAAKMVILDVDHPEIRDFIDWKVREEKKAEALIAAGFGDHFESEAYRTVSGQNGNNSVRVSDAFMKAVEADLKWSLRNRVNGEKVSERPAREIWQQMAEAAWNCADPGVQFHDAINAWHTSPAAGEIRASNPCSEYMFLDDSACNLASLNLLKFLDEKGRFDVAAFRQAARILFFAQEVLVDLASYPTQKIAQNSHDYRPLGLGLAGLGSFLIQKGIPYASDEARAWAAAITALMTGVAYDLSAEMARQFGPFAGWKKNKTAMAKVMTKHRAALSKVDFAHVGEIPKDEVREIWDRVVQSAQSSGFRNAQATVIAPTGTIGLVMDSETTGIEPEYALVRRKNLAGGGALTLVSSSLKKTLENLDFPSEEIQKITGWANRQGTVKGCPFLNEDQQKIFATALEIDPEDHLKMMATVQPFVSGAISKTVNLPKDATAASIEKLYFQAWKEGLKSISIYRDYSKASQPLEAKAPICDECGSTTELSGSCFRCTNCGTVVGCG